MNIYKLSLLFLFSFLFVSCGGGGAGGSGGDTTAPAVVSGLTASAVSATQIDLSWDASLASDEVTGYKVYRGVGAGTGTFQNSVTGTSTSDAGLTPSTEYCYQITAVDVAGNESVRSTKQCVSTQAVQAFSGFDFALATGDFWEYQWDYYKSSVAQGSSPSTNNDSGRFWVVLGDPTTIQGITSYAVKLYGKSKNTDKTFSPRWKYIAIANNQLLGSIDGTTLTPFFDALTGKWPGGGFFTTLPASTLSTGKNGSISTYNTFISGAAIVTGRSSSQSQCEYFPGFGTICGDSSYNYTENEYFRPSIGPVGFFYYNTYSSCGGGFCSGATWRHNVGLTASSFNSQTNPLVDEIEPNDSSVIAQSITTASPIIGNVSESTLANVGNTVIGVTYTPDSGGTVTDQPTVEDWYAFTLPSAKTVTITMSFEGSPTSDLDMFLIDSAVTTLFGYSVHDNVTRNEQTETITQNLAAGSYLIGVDGYQTSSGPVTYTLQFE